MKTNEQLRELLTGDDGRVCRKCETCGGSGELPTDCSACEHGKSLEVCPVLKNHHYKGPCPDCDGGWVYNERRFELACRLFVKDVRRIGKKLLVHLNDGLRQFYMPVTNENRFDAAGMWAWSNRRGEPWQAALEAHVDEYTEPAPDYRNDTEALKAALRQGGYAYNVFWVADEELFNASVHKSPWDGSHAPEEYGDTEAEALWNAVQAAVEGE